MAAGPSGISAGEIAERLEVPRPTLSFHLNQLSGAGLLEDRKAGRSVIYAARMEGIGELLEYLIKDCCQGDPGACGITEIVALGRCEPPASLEPREQE